VPCDPLGASAAARKRSAILAVAACAAFGAAPAASAQGLDFGITTLSSRPDTVTAGDALIRIDVPRTVPMDTVSVTVNGTVASAIFHRDAAAGTMTGLVRGLKPGNNTVAVTARGYGNGSPVAVLVLTNHPKEGPIFSGPAQTPFICQTQQFALLVIGGNLGPAINAQCGVATRVDYIYRTTAGAFAPWPANAASYPGDLAKTTTSRGVTVPYIVRMEHGTAGRSIYEIAILHDPLRERTPSFHQRPKGWNGRLIYTFGGGCIRGWYRQGSSTGGVLDHFMLSNGYAVASSSLNVFGNNCQDVTAAEAMMVVKERFIEAYGPPSYTMGFGCSGGSYQQHQIADNYPGLLDGIIPGCSFPEVGFGTIQFITDAWLLDSYFESRAAVDWSAEERRRVTGFAVYATAPNVAIGARRIDPRVFCPDALPVSQRYDPVKNPNGARCDVYDHTVNVYGRDPATGFARRPLDNVGIQYGLRALNDGAISVEQFLDLNEKIGGFDVDANIVPERTEGDLLAARAAYQTGRLTNAGGGLASIPIIDYRAYNDDVPGGDIHVRYHSFSMRARLLKANGRADNQVMLVEDNRYGLYGTSSPMLRHAIIQLDRWLANVSADASADPAIDKVARAKPATLREGCNTRDPRPTFVAQTQVRDASTACEQLYPSASFPREVAGAGVASDVIKCQLKAIDWGDYAVNFTAQERARLRRIFPQGVCDWSKPGVEQQGLIGTWVNFGGD
jgi:hypothetical protein